MAHDPQELRFALALFREEDPKMGEAWRHKKTLNLYLVVAQALFESTLDPMIVYVRHPHDPQDPNAAFHGGWIRPLDEFNEKFERVEG